jgi:hypothetical protein
MKKLSYKYAIIVPSDYNGSGYTHSQAQAEVEKYLSELCGGCTSTAGKGNWVNSNGDLVTEEVIIVTAYSELDVAERLRAYAIEACKRWTQESVAIEHSNALWLIEASDQPMI